MQGQSPPAPIRGSAKGREGQAEGEEAENQDEEETDVMDMLPRTDIRLASEHVCPKKVMAVVLIASRKCKFVQR